MTVAQALSEGRAILSATGLVDAAREARFLTANGLGVPESWLAAHRDRVLSAADVAILRDWFGRRAAGEPAHYIVGRCPFWNREFSVTPAVLIPRPETELIVERVLRLDLPAGARVLDVGTGSGCLAVTLACERPGWRVFATDRSPAALGVARRNARALGAQVRFVCADLAGPLAARFALVVANLPYIPSAECATLQREIREHEPMAALIGGEHGDELVLALIAQLPAVLATGGVAALELGVGQADAVARRADVAGFASVERIVDLGGVERVVVLRAPD